MIIVIVETQVEIRLCNHCDLRGVSGVLQVVTPGRTADEVQLPAIHATLNAPPRPTHLLPLNNKETASTLFVTRNNSVLRTTTFQC